MKICDKKCFSIDNEEREVFLSELKNAMGYGLELTIKKIFNDNWKVTINKIYWKTTRTTLSWCLDFDAVEKNPYERLGVSHENSTEGNKSPM